MDLKSWVEMGTSITAIAISLWNVYRDRKNREDSQRPYVACALKTLTIQEMKYCCMILKNYGQTGAYVTSVKAKPGLNSFFFTNENNPFSNMTMQFIAPGQSYSAFICILDREKKFRLFKEPTDSIIVDEFDLSLEYIGLKHAGIRQKKYSEKYHFSLTGIQGFDKKAPEPDYNSGGADAAEEIAVLKNIARSISVAQAEKAINELNKD